MLEIYVTLILLIREPFSTVTSEPRTTPFPHDKLCGYSRDTKLWYNAGALIVNFIMSMRLLKTEKLQQDINSVLLLVHK